MKSLPENIKPSDVRCEWCNTQLQPPLRPIPESEPTYQFYGYCPKCCRKSWSKEFPKSDKIQAPLPR